MTVTHRFGRFELLPATRQLAADGQPVALGGRAFDLLLTLVERRDRLVAKNELLELVWPGLVVEENNLQVHISALRKVLGQHAIATVAGHGYRFTLEMTEATTEAAAPSAPKRHLPVPLASFIGRERELTDLRAMLTRHRLVTLTGVGGIGKTRLALELATSVADAYADGAWFADLSSISDPRLVAPAVAATLRVHEEPGRPISETLCEFVRDRALLLLLDNCEHLLLPCAQLANSLLQAGPGMTIVATSREPLHVSGEATFPVAALPVPDPTRELMPDELSTYAAVRLLLDRALAARPDFRLTRQNAAAVARICSDLDGIPLALELAAARLRAMSTEVIAAHLTDRFRLLKGGDLSALPRQQTLRATIDWSHELLTPQERTLLRRLSVFAGGFAIDGAEAVGAGDDIAASDVLDLLGRLVEKSMVAFDVQHERYRLLETVRQYALERLMAAGEEARSRDQHLRFHAALADRAGRGLSGPEQATWCANLDAERENILRAFAHAHAAPGGGPTGLAMVHALNWWFGFGQLELWYRVANEALAHPDAQQASAARARALYATAFIAYCTGRHAEAFALAETSVGIARAVGDPQALREGLYNLGLAAIAVDRPDDAGDYFDEGLALAQQAGDRTAITMMSCGLGELHTQQDRHALAEAAYLEALACSGDPESTVILLGNLARTAIMLGAEAKAVRYLRDGTAKAGPQCSQAFAEVVLRNCAGIAALRGEWALALRMSGAGEAHNDRYGLQGDVVDAPMHDRAMAPARNALGTEASDAAFAAGRALDSGEALAEVAAWLEALPDS